MNSNSEVNFEKPSTALFFNKGLLFALTCISIALLASAPSAQLSPQELNALTLYLKAADNHSNLTDVEAAQKAQQALLSYPDYAYSAQLKLASLTCMKARFEWFPNKKLGHVTKGIDLFNELRKEALNSQDPNKLYEFHFYRGMTYINFPSFLNKKSQAIEDLKKVERLHPSLKRPLDELKHIQTALYGDQK